MATFEEAMKELRDSLKGLEKAMKKIDLPPEQVQSLTTLVLAEFLATIWGTDREVVEQAAFNLATSLLAADSFTIEMKKPKRRTHVRD